MAEENAASGQSEDVPTPTMDEITSGLMLGQSKSTGKNKMVLVCQLCRCRVIRPGYATLVDKEVFVALKHCIDALAFMALLS